MVNHIYTTVCLRKRPSIPWHEVGNNPRGKLRQLHADLLASGVHSEPFYYPPPELNSVLPQLSPLPLTPDSTQNGSASAASPQALLLQSLSSPVKSAQRTLTNTQGGYTHRLCVSSTVGRGCLHSLVSLRGEGSLWILHSLKASLRTRY